jgi:hypothetical protein
MQAQVKRYQEAKTKGLLVGTLMEGSYVAGKPEFANPRFQSAVNYRVYVVDCPAAMESRRLVLWCAERIG